MGAYWEQWETRVQFVFVIDGLKMLDLHFLVCVKVRNETQADPWETMQPLMGLGGIERQGF